MPSLEVELLQNIIDELATSKSVEEPEGVTDVDTTLLNLRLVSRTFSRLSTAHVFGTSIRSCANVKI